MNDGNVPCGIILDLSKGFDTLAHDIMLQKIKRYGRTNSAKPLFKNYLMYRKIMLNLKILN